MIPTPKESLFGELTSLLRKRKALDEEITSVQKMLTEAKRLELRRSSKSLPYLDGRISKHVLEFLKEHGPTPREELVTSLLAGGAAKLRNNPQKEVNKSIDRLMDPDVAKVIDTPAGLDIGHPKKPVKKPGLFGKKRRNE